MIRLCYCLCKIVLCFLFIYNRNYYGRTVIETLAAAVVEFLYCGFLNGSTSKTF